jgi:hypothetical protein
VLKSSFVGGHNQVLHIGPRSHRVPGSSETVNLFNCGAALRPGLLGTLVRASLDLSATDPGCYKPRQFLVLILLMALPDTWSLPDEAWLWNSCILSFPGLTDTVSSPRWSARTAHSLLRWIKVQTEAVSGNSFVGGYNQGFSVSPWSHWVPGSL